MWATKGSDRRKAKRYLRRVNDALNDPHEDVAKHWEAALTQAPPRDPPFLAITPARQESPAVH
jgi:hypothetical protein